MGREGAQEGRKGLEKEGEGEGRQKKGRKGRAVVSQWKLVQTGNLC